jgi:hypothetical protein
MLIKMEAWGFFVMKILFYFKFLYFILLYLGYTVTFTKVFTVYLS